MAADARWSIADSAALYGLERWGDPYFSVNARGHVIVQPRGDRGGALDLVELNPFLDERGRTAKLMVELVGSMMGRKVFDRPTRSF